MSEANTASDGALAGVRVIDLTINVLGPMATLMLGEMGADVIKIEAPGGDPTRALGAWRNPGMAAHFVQFNRSKRSVVQVLEQRVLWGQKMNVVVRGASSKESRAVRVQCLTIKSVRQ